MAIELLLIAMPSTFLLLVFALAGLVPEVSRRPDLSNWALTAASAIADAGLVSGWVLGLSFVIGGTSALAARRAWWWVLGVCGGAVALLALASQLVKAEENSLLHSFLESFAMFALGLPLLLPFAHLAMELRRRGKNARS